MSMLQLCSATVIMFLMYISKVQIQKQNTTFQKSLQGHFITQDF